MMSAGDFSNRREAVTYLESKFARRADTLAVAREMLARALRISVGTLEGIRRGRVTDLRESVGRRIDDALIAALKAEIAEAENALALARARVALTNRGESAENVPANLSTRLNQLRALLRDAPNPSG